MSHYTDQTLRVQWGKKYPRRLWFHSVKTSTWITAMTRWSWAGAMLHVSFCQPLTLASPSAPHTLSDTQTHNWHHWHWFTDTCTIFKCWSLALDLKDIQLWLASHCAALNHQNKIMTTKLRHSAVPGAEWLESVPRSEKQNYDTPLCQAPNDSSQSLDQPYMYYLIQCRPTRVSPASAMYVTDLIQCRLNSLTV